MPRMMPQRQPIDSRPSPDTADTADTAGPAIDPSRLQLPAVWVGEQMEEVGEKAKILLSRDSGIFQRDGQLVRVSQVTPSGRPWLKVAEGSPSIQAWTSTPLRSRLSALASWYTRDRRSKRGWKEDIPPEWLPRLLIESSDHTVPLLVGIVEAPTLRPDGSVLTQPGYDEETGLYHVASPTLSVSVPALPSKDDARTALAAITEPIAEFPFVTPVDRAAMIAAIVSPCVRSAILGHCPFFLITGNASGAGKTKLADVVSGIAYGRTAGRMTASPEEEEMRKRITSIASMGMPLVLLDNIETSGSAFGCPQLDSALTGPTWNDRPLGANRIVCVPMRTVWIATGNNVSIRGDLSRRTIPIRLRSDVERPERRSFRIPNLEQWVQENRGRLLSAVLTLVRAWFAAGRPDIGLSDYGSFDDWSDIARASIVWAGEADPYEGQESLRAEYDPDVEATSGVLQEWYGCFGSRLVTGADLMRKSSPSLRAALAAAVESKDGTLSPGTIGPWLRRRRDCIIESLALRKVDKKSQWWVEDRRGASDAGEEVP